MYSKSLPFFILVVRDFSLFFPLQKSNDFESISERRSEPLDLYVMTVLWLDKLW